MIATIATLGDRDGDGGDAAPVRGAETSVEVAVPDTETLPGRVTS
ncbi:Uncharacterised protein [Mycobacteroides abscessus]|nr:Uncharacterised protein [Mycobacteroides abscessus]